MLTPENFKTMVGYQPSKDADELTEEPVEALAFLLCPQITVEAPDDWTKKIPTMTNDEVLEKLIDDSPPKPVMSLNITKMPVLCDKTFDEVLAEASNALKNLPKFQVTNVFDENKAKNRIAFKTRRGAGNAKLENVLVYRGTNDFDCALVIVKRGGRYGMVKQEHFVYYGFVLEDVGTKV